MIIIPSIALRNHQVVSLTQGNFEQPVVYHNETMAYVRYLQQAGFRQLHLTDLDGLTTGNPVHLSDMEAIAIATGLQVYFSGGVRSTAAVQHCLSAGAHRIVLGTMSVEAFSRVADWTVQYGPGRFVIAADVSGDQLLIEGRQKEAGLTWEYLFDFYLNLGIDQFIVTDVARQGLLAGCHIELYARIREHFPEARLYASGGISTIEELQRLSDLGCHGAVVGRALLEEQITPQQLIQLHQS